MLHIRQTDHFFFGDPSLSCSARKNTPLHQFPRFVQNLKPVFANRLHYLRQLILVSNDYDVQFAALNLSLSNLLLLFVSVIKYWSCHTVAHSIIDSRRFPVTAGYRRALRKASAERMNQKRNWDQLRKKGLAHWAMNQMALRRTRKKTTTWSW